MTAQVNTMIDNIKNTFPSDSRLVVEDSFNVFAIYLDFNDSSNKNIRSKFLLLDLPVAFSDFIGLKQTSLLKQVLGETHGVRIPSRRANFSSDLYGSNAIHNSTQDKLVTLENKSTPPTRVTLITRVTLVTI